MPLIFFAIKENDVEIVKSLLLNPNFDVNFQYQIFTLIIIWKFNTNFCNSS